MDTPLDAASTVRAPPLVTVLPGADRRPQGRVRRPWRAMLTGTLLAVLTLTAPCAGDDNEEARLRPVAQGEAQDGGVVSVPDLVGLSRNKALCRLEKRGLRHRDLGPPGPSKDPCRRGGLQPNPTIVSQWPRAGARVRKGSVVVLAALPAREAGIVFIPDIVGSTRKEAICRLRKVGLRSRIQGPPGPFKDPCERGGLEPNPTIIAQRPRAEAQVRKGSVVELVPPPGPDAPVVSVPKIVGRPYTKAVCRLKELGLRADSDLGLPGASDNLCEGEGGGLQPNPTITSQRPRVGTHVRKGSVVVFKTRCSRRRPCL